MSRIAAIDYGEKYIGIALSDALQITVQESTTFLNEKDILKKLKVLFDKNLIEEIVVGYPLTMKGEKGKKANEVLGFILSLKKVLTQPIIKWDERLTTVSTKRILQTEKRKIKQNKKIINKISASLILQSYLEFRKNIDVIKNKDS